MPTEQERSSAFARACKGSIPAGHVNSGRKNHHSDAQPPQKFKNTNQHHRLDSPTILVSQKSRRPNSHHESENPRIQASRALKTTTLHQQGVKQATHAIQVRKTPIAKSASVRVSHAASAEQVTKSPVGKPTPTPTPTTLRITQATSSRHMQILNAPQEATNQQKMAVKQARRTSAIVNEAVYIGVLIYDSATETFYIMKPVTQSAQSETSQPQSNGPAVIDDLPPLGFCTIEQPQSVESVVWRVTNPDRNSMDSGRSSVHSRRDSVHEYPSCVKLETASSSSAEYRTGVPEHRELFFGDGVSHVSAEVKSALPVPLNSVQQHGSVLPGSSQGYLRTIGSYNATHSPDHPRCQGPLGSRETSQSRFPRTLEGEPLQPSQIRLSVIAELASPEIPHIVIHSASPVANSYQFKAGSAQSVSGSSLLPHLSAHSAQLGREASKVGVRQHDLPLQDLNAVSANAVRPLSLHPPTGQSFSEELLRIFEEKIFGLGR
jgi:hypothetical protein